MFFNKPKVKYNFLNDIDNDVYNLFMVLKNSPDELYEKIKDTPYHESIFKNWLKNKETEPIWKALRFLYLSNYSIYGAGTTLMFNLGDSKKLLLQKIKISNYMLDNAQFFNSDFRNVLNKINFKGSINLKKTFIYADPPYLSTDNNYSNDFKESDSIDLFNLLYESNIKFAMSEFKNPFIINQAKQRNLNIYEITERRTLKSRNTEILITNYDNEVGLF